MATISSTAALSNGFHPVPPGKIATVVTHLAMRSKAPDQHHVKPDGISVRRVEQPDIAWYRDLYSRVGADWLWFSRLQMTEPALRDIIHSPAVEIFALVASNRDEGLLELDFRQPGACELAFFGLTSKMIGKGAGRHLMQVASDRAWSRPIAKFWVHTCSLDHPQALGFYQRAGFVPYAQEIEIADDPRLRGDLPMTAAPHVPIIAPK